MALKLTRKPDQKLLLSVAPGTTAEQLFEQLNAGIMIQVCFVDGQAVTLGITAPNCLNIIRPEKHSVEEWQGRPKARQPLWRRLLLGLRAPAAGQ